LGIGQAMVLVVGLAAVRGVGAGSCAPLGGLEGKLVACVATKLQAEVLGPEVLTPMREDLQRLAAEGTGGNPRRRGS
jgi:hypothetical protein